ncbi:hypothetical protein [Thermoactinomyces mirandus]|uniref:Lipoprotein n=1 Tax=Thermoactinomyces mirandus TaxID=2756294 RepID=A0A7W1XRD3_9BACL|nr:hypothetical protein [Thermoactinomyces mirandus]MBA4601772.1 hypothetical protein [Thermoactinomyces mirandus]
MLKKALILFCSFFLLTGCSFFTDYHLTNQLVDSIDQLVKQENANDWTRKNMDMHYKNMELSMNEFNRTIQETGNADPDKLKKLLKEMDMIIAELGKYKAEEDSIRQQLAQQIETAQKLSDEKKQLVMPALNHFKQLVERESRLAEVNILILQTNKKYYSALVKKVKPPKDQYEQLNKERKQLLKEIQSLIPQFNQSWEKLSQEITGQPLKKTN